MSTNDLSKTFSASTAAARIEDSVRLLTAGFRFRLLELANGGDPGVSRRAELAADRIWLGMHALEDALKEAARLFNSQGITAEGRDLTEEDRALARVLAQLRELAETSWPVQEELDLLLKHRDIAWAQGQDEGRTQA